MKKLAVSKAIINALSSPVSLPAVLAGGSVSVTFFAAYFL